LLATNINIRWLALKTTLIAYYNQSQAGQPLLTSSAHYTSTLPFTWEQPHNYTISFSSSLAVRFRTAALLIRRLTTLAFNAAYISNTYFNCGKLSYRLPNYLLSYALCAKLKKLKELLESNLEDNKHLTNKTEKDTL
jgi:hypothetical protein